MKTFTATNFNQNMLAIAVRFLMLVVAIASLSLPQNVSAMDVCLSGPWTTIPDDYCTATVTITPATRSVAPGTSVDIDLSAFTQYQWFTGGWSDVEATMSNGVTLYTGWPSGSGFSSTVSSGPLASSVTLQIWGMTNQGVVDVDTDYIDVIPTLTSFDIIPNTPLVAVDTINFNWNVTGAMTSIEYYITGPASTGSAGSPRSAASAGSGSLTGLLSDSAFLGIAPPVGSYTGYLRACNSTSCSAYQSDTFDIVVAPSVNLNFIP